jgi:hypothetical protein
VNKITSATPDADGLFALETTGARLFVHITCSLQGSGCDPKWVDWAGSALHAMLCAAQLAGLSSSHSWELERFCYAPKLTGESVAMIHEAARLAERAIPGIALALTTEMERIARA